MKVYSHLALLEDKSLDTSERRDSSMKLNDFLKSLCCFDSLNLP